MSTRKKFKFKIPWWAHIVYSLVHIGDFVFDIIYLSTTPLEMQEYKLIFSSTLVLPIYVVMIFAII